jgi:hypothetical protein
VEQRGDRLGLVSSVFQDEPSDDHQVRGVRDLGAETSVTTVHLVGERGGGEEPVGQTWRGRRRGDQSSVVPSRAMQGSRPGLSLNVHDPSRRLARLQGCLLGARSLIGDVHARPAALLSLLCSVDVVDRRGQRKGC